MMREVQVETFIQEMTLEEKISLCTGKNFWQTQNIDRLGIPSITMSDGTNGVRFQKDSTSEEKKTFADAIKGAFDTNEAIENTHLATCFPTGSAIACSWDRKLVWQVGSAIAKECKALGIDLLLGPGINTRRHPLTARNYEYYSEDPCLAGDLAAAMIEGIQKEGVGTSVKHFACHNSDSYRTRVNVKVKKRALREIYLSCFERAIKKSQPLTVMSAYNQVNDLEVSGDSPLIRDILKKEWNYNGAVICDWGAIKDSIEATKGGIDLQMPHCEGSSERLRQAVENGLIKMDLIDERVRRILTLVFRIQEMKQKPQPVDFNLQHQLARQAAAEGAVLLKNDDNILPLNKKSMKKLAIVGYLAENPVYQGSGCAIVRSITVDAPLDCIRSICADDVQVNYAKGYDDKDVATEETLNEAVSAAKDADVVLVFAGNKCLGETDDYNRKDIVIEPGHQQLLDAVTVVNNQVVVVLASGEVVEIPWMNQVKGILEMWYGGEGSGWAAAELLFGHANPCGKLSATMPVKLEHTPAYLGFVDEPFTIDYSEGIFVGYRYYDKKMLEPRFPFGFGLSYTTFEYSDLHLSQTEVKNPEELQDIHVTALIKNTGDRQGKEIVELYIGQETLTCQRPVRELKGFEKVSLMPGESKQVTFHLCQRDFAYYDDEADEFVVDVSKFTIEIGASSRDIRLSSTLEVLTSNKKARALRFDCGFTELFENPKTKEAFDRFLEKHGIIKPGEADELMHKRMLDSFWSVSSYLDMNAGAAVGLDEIREFIEHNALHGKASF